MSSVSNTSEGDPSGRVAPQAQTNPTQGAARASCTEDDSILGIMGAAGIELPSGVFNVFKGLDTKLPPVTNEKGVPPRPEVQTISDLVETVSNVFFKLDISMNELKRLINFNQDLVWRAPTPALAKKHQDRVAQLQGLIDTFNAHTHGNTQAAKA